MKQPAYHTERVAQIIGAQVVQPPSNRPVAQLLLDSRRVAGNAAGMLFFAIEGKTHNGHDFLAELYRKGVRQFVVARPPAPGHFPEAAMLVVGDTLSALQRLATHHRSQFSLPVLAVTGSNGKTVVKEWLYQLLWKEGNLLRSPRSYNSQVGVPLSVWELGQTHTLAIFEAGISQPGEMGRLQKIIQPDFGIFTNIGAAHDEGFESRRQKTREKMRLFRHVDALYYCRDHALIHQAALENGIPSVTWSRSQPDTDLFVQSVEKKAESTQISCRFRGADLGFAIPFGDDASVENALHCALFALHQAKMQPQLLAGRMAALAPVAMRLELKEGINGCTIINDSYNSDLNSLDVALDCLADQRQHPRKTLILSDILQSGQQAQSLYAQVAKVLKSRKVDRLIGVGGQISAAQHLFGGLDAAFYAGTDALLRHLPVFSNEAVLIKGARSFAFEKVAAALQHRVHGTTLQIDLGAIAANFKAYRNRLAPSVRMMVMVKALGYGSGGVEVANVLQYNKADYLAVAYTDEGVALRNAGITLPIMVMNANPGSFGQLLRHRLEPELFALSQAAHLERFLQSLPADENLPLKVHVKLDTGMNRLGFSAGELPQLIGFLKRNGHIRVVSVLSHLAASDEGRHDGFSKLQISRFVEMCGQLQGHLPGPIWRHLLNTAGIARFPQAHFDMVRLGLGLYGIDPSGQLQGELQNVGTLKTYVSQVKEVPPGETVGYGRRGAVDGKAVVATVGIGYGDGYFRAFGNGVGKMLLRGRLAPVIGNVCMDMCMLDVTHIPGVRAGDEVTVFGERLPVAELAQAAGTIPYEILTSVGQRVRRVYFRE